MELHPNQLGNYQKASFITQSRLIDSFNQYKIPEFYQNIFVNHLKNLEPIQAEITMREEIQSLSSPSSFIQFYLKKCAEKQKWQNFVRTLMSYSRGSQQSQVTKIIKICPLILYLRDINYKCGYFLLKIRMKYEENVNIYESIEKYYYNSFAIKLDSFRKELIKGFLNQYIEFMPEYDPFFMNIKLKKPHNNKQCNEAFQTLMEFTVEDSYKYLKMRKVLMDWIYMHSKKQNLDKNLERFSLPALIPNQEYIQYDRLKEELLREKIRDKVSQEQHPQIKRNLIHLNRIQNKFASSKGFADRPGFYERVLANKQYLDTASLQKFDLEHKRRLKSQLSQNPYKQLNFNSESQNLKLRVKSQALDYEPETSSFVGRIKRLKLPNNRSIESSPIILQSRRSETLPILNRQTSENQFGQIYTKEYYNGHFNQKGQKLKYRNNQRPRLQKLSAFQIYISPEKNDLNQGKSNHIEVRLQNSNEVLKKQQMKKLQNQLKGQKTMYPKIVESLDQKQTYKPKYQINVQSGNATASKTRQQEKKNQVQQKNLNQSPILINQKFTESQHRRGTQNDLQIRQSNRKSKLTEPQKKDLLNRAVNPSNEETYKKSINPSKQNQENHTVKQPIDSNISKKQINLKIKEQENVKSKKQANQQNNNMANGQEKKNAAIMKRQLQFSPTNDKNSIQSIQNTTKVQKKNHIIDEQQRLPIKSSKVGQKGAPTDKSSTIQNKNVKTQNNKPEQYMQQKMQAQSKSQLQIAKTDQPKKQEKPKTEEKRQIKMIIGKYTFQGFKDYLSNYKIHKQQLKFYELQKILKEIQHQQTYITEFLINGQPGVLAIVYITSNSKLILRLWALRNNQDINLSFPLFKKFIDYIQKLTTNQKIYYKGLQLPQLSKVGFVKKKDDLFERERINQPKQLQLQFQQCFSIQCSQIKFIQKQKEEILVSAQIQNFTVQNSHLASFFYEMAEEKIPQQLNSLIKINKNIANFKLLNKILQKDDCDKYETNQKINVENISLSLFNFLSNFRDVFLTSEGFFKFYGNFVKQTQRKIICSIKLSKNNGRICFAKGYKTALEVANDIAQQTPSKTQFWVPMFNKKLYGRFKNYKIPNEDCYANWDISLSWQDEMQGALKYAQRKGINFGVSSFFVSIQIEGSQLYIFEVHQDDYIY